MSLPIILYFFSFSTNLLAMQFYTCMFWLFNSDTLQVLMFVCPTFRSFAFMDDVIFVFKIKIKYWLILAEIIHRNLIFFLVMKLLYNFKCPSVHPSIYKTKSERIVIQDTQLKLLVNIHIIIEHNIYSLFSISEYLFFI